MLVIGAKGHAVEILQLFHQKNEIHNLGFYDDVNPTIGDFLYQKYKIYHSIGEVEELFKTDSRFVLGIGNPQIRQKLTEKFENLGGNLSSIIASDSVIGNYEVTLNKGLNIMSATFISNNVSIGKGSLINRGASIHHDCVVGQYCEISPGAQILGGVSIGDFCFIGAGAIILPKVTVGANAIIGAGAVVLHNVSDNTTIVGVPGKNI